MLKKLIVVVLVIFIAQTTLIAHAGMHFPGTADVYSGTFVGWAQVEGFGNTDLATVSLNLQGSGLYALCKNPGGNIAPGQKPININVTITSPNLPVSKSGKASFNFNVPLLNVDAAAAGCPNGNWTVSGLKGTLYPTYYGRDYSSKTGLLTALATLAYRCDIDESINAHTSCVELYETAVTY